MAKLFKTISLEERYNSSIHNELPAKVKAVNQGSILLQPAKPSKELESALLKTLPNAVEQNSAILKGMVKGPESIPPFVNTKFRSAISLADRLSQPKIGSTTHLAQYFLSDVNTDYIKITPFGIFNHTSTTIVQPVKTDIAQGGQSPIAFNPMVNQGLIYANGFASSVINVSVPTYDSLLLQGTFFSNGVYSSFTTTTSPLGVNQGSGTNPITAITNAAILATQGTIIINNSVKSITNIVRSRLSGTIPQKGNVVLGMPKSVPLLEDYTTEWFDSSKGMLVSQVGLGTPQKALEQYGNIILNIPKSIVQLEDYSTRWFDSATGQMVSQTDLGTPKGGIELVQTRPVLALPKEEQSPQLNQITFEPKYTFPVLKSLRYAADRALASFSPTVKHGSSGIPTSVTKEGSTYFQDAAINQEISPLVTALVTTNGLAKYLNGATPQTFVEPQITTETTNTTYGGLGQINKPFPNKYEWTFDYNLIVKDSIDLMASMSVDVSKQISTTKGAPSRPTIGVGSTEGNKLATKNFSNLNSLSDYQTLTYDQITAKSKNPSTIGTDFRDDLRRDGTVINGLFTVKYIDNVTPNEYINTKKKGSVEERSPLGESRANGKSDFINLSIKSLGSNNAITFRSYITNFSDSWTNTWEDTKLLNRLETLHSYRGVVRGGSVAFKVPALSKTDMGIIYGKLQNLVRITSIPTAPTTTGTMMKAPICSFTLGRWYINTPIAVNSVKYDLQMADYAWDIDEQRPQIVDVSMDFRFIVGIDDTTSVPTAGLIPFA